MHRMHQWTPCWNQIPIKEFGNATSLHYSENYCCYGLNIKTIGDMNLCFMVLLLLPLGSHLDRLLSKWPHGIESFLSSYLVCMAYEMLLTQSQIRRLDHSLDLIIKNPTRIHQTISQVRCMYTLTCCLTAETFFRNYHGFMQNTQLCLLLLFPEWMQP